MMRDSRSFFTEAHHAARKIEEMQRIISSGGEEYQARHGSAGGSKPEHSDPTAQAAIRLGAILDWAKAEQQAAEETVGEALEVLAGVEIGLGRDYADVLELRYIDGMPWVDVCMFVGKSRSQANRYMAVAHDWVDSQGIERVKMIGKGKATSIL